MSRDLVWVAGEGRPRGLCWCGCGRPTRAATKTNSKYRSYKGLPTRWLPGHGHASLVVGRFETFVERSETGCWLWIGTVNSAGYGTVSDRGRKVYAHRVSHELFIGPIPNGLEVDHLCRVKNCVNPEHLEAVTHAENQRRMRQANAMGEYAERCANGHWSCPRACSGARAAESA